MSAAVTTVELFLIAMVVIFTVPFLIWRLGRTEYFAPLVVVQIVTGVLLGPGLLGAWWPQGYEFIFTPAVIQALNGLAWWAVSIFVFLAGLELDLRQAWAHRRSTSLTAGLALGVPLLLGCVVGLLLLAHQGWIGPRAQDWQFVAGIGMACAVTALPILVLLMDKMGILRQPLGQRILRLAALDDIAIWGVLAVILMDWSRVGRQLIFLLLFIVAASLVRRWMPRLSESDRWYSVWIWLALVALGADWAGLHFMVGAFLAGAVLDTHWFGVERVDSLRHHVLMLMMPVFFLSTGLRTNWELGGATVLLVATLLLAASVGGKLLGVWSASKLLGWSPGEAAIVGWLLQTKALIEIIFANILLDKQIITSETFTALLLMAVASTMLTVPIVTPMLRRNPQVATRNG